MYYVHRKPFFPPLIIIFRSGEAMIEINEVNKAVSLHKFP